MTGENFCLMKRLGLNTSPRLAVADGALGFFWKALGEIWPTTREQRCWVHKTANVLNKLPRSLGPKAKRSLQKIWMAETKADADIAFDAFIETYTLKYEKAASCLAKNRDPLLAFYNFPTEHWVHLRTSNPIESRSQQCAIERSGRRDASQTKRHLPWSTSPSMAHRKPGGASMVRSSCQRSFKV